MQFRVFLATINNLAIIFSLIFDAIAMTTTPEKVIPIKFQIKISFMRDQVLDFRVL